MLCTTMFNNCQSIKERRIPVQALDNSFASVFQSATVC